MRLTLFRNCQLYATGASAPALAASMASATHPEPLQQFEGESTHSPKSLGNDDSDDSEGSASDCDTTRMSYDASTSSSDLSSLGCAALVTCPSTISINNNEYESSYFSFPESRSFDLTYTGEEEEVSQAVEDDSDSPSEVSSTSTSYYNTICNVFGYFTSKSSNTNVENVKATPAAVTADAITPEHASLRDSGYGDGGRTLIPRRVSKKRISKPIVGPVTASLMHSGLAHPRKLPRRLTLINAQMRRCSHGAHLPYSQPPTSGDKSFHTSLPNTSRPSTSDSSSRSTWPKPSARRRLRSHSSNDSPVLVTARRTSVHKLEEYQFRPSTYSHQYSVVFEIPSYSFKS